jgi:hypothetical protein
LTFGWWGVDCVVGYEVVWLKMVGKWKRSKRTTIAKHGMSMLDQRCIVSWREIKKG